MTNRATSSTSLDVCSVDQQETAGNKPESLHVQRFLRGGGTIEALLSRFGIKAKPHPRFPNLWLLKYNQIDSPFGERIVQECRGIILDAADDWRIVSRAFDKFFNDAEGHAASIDWTTARVQTKRDGSLAVLYAYAGEWHVATSGTPDAGGDVNGYGITFADYFWQTLRSQYTSCPNRELPDVDCGMCFYFELTGPINRIVVRYTEPSLVMLGARDMRTQIEMTATEAADRFLPGFPVVDEHPLRTLDDVKATYGKLSPLENEGFVVVDGAWNRIKCKLTSYVALHRLAGNGRMSPKRALELVRIGETTEVLAAFPEYAEIVSKVQDAYAALIDEAERLYARHWHIDSQKDFALAIKDSRVKHALFAVRGKKSPSIAEYFRNGRLDVVLGLLGYADEPDMEAEAAQ